MTSLFQLLCTDDSMPYLECLIETYYVRMSELSHNPSLSVKILPHVILFYLPCIYHFYCNLKLKHDQQNTSQNNKGTNKLSLNKEHLIFIELHRQNTIKPILCACCVYV